MAPASLLRRIWRYLTKRPAPAPLVALYLSLRWRCRVSPSARIDWPHRLRIGAGSRLYACRIMAQGPIVLGERCELHDFAYLDTQTAEGSITLGNGTAIGPQTIVFGSGGVAFGEGCSIAGQSMIVSSTHVTADIGRPIRAQGFTSAPIVIEDDVWLGAQCMVLPGTVIGRGAIVGAKSLVRGTVPPLVMAAGMPVRVIKQRQIVTGTIKPGSVE